MLLIIRLQPFTPGLSMAPFTHRVAPFMRICSPSLQFALALVAGNARLRSSRQFSFSVGTRWRLRDGVRRAVDHSTGLGRSLPGREPRCGGSRS